MTITEAPPARRNPFAVLSRSRLIPMRSAAQFDVGDKRETLRRLEAKRQAAAGEHRLADVRRLDDQIRGAQRNLERARQELASIEEALGVQLAQPAPTPTALDRAAELRALLPRLALGASEGDAAAAKELRAVRKELDDAVDAQELAGLVETGRAERAAEEARQRQAEERSHHEKTLPAARQDRHAAASRVEAALADLNQAVSDELDADNAVRIMEGVLGLPSGRGARDVMVDRVGRVLRPLLGPAMPAPFSVAQGSTPLYEVFRP